MLPSYPSTAEMLAQLEPREPVYCIYPAACRRAAEQFVGGFPGRVLYAVKANDHPEVLRLLHRAGIDAFDCASLPEIERVRQHCPSATPFFMTPVRLRGAARAAFERFGVRHFLVDDESGLQALGNEVALAECTVFVRMMVRHEAALMDFSAKFGAPPDAVPALLDEVARCGAEPALAFNVGSSVTHPDAYRSALGQAAGVLSNSGHRPRLLDIGGGFPLSYPGFEVPPMEAYFAAISEMREGLPLADDACLLAEPGRALAAPGLSAVVETLLRKDDRLYINDGMFGIFWELRFKGHKRYPCRVFREGREVTGNRQSFRLFGPTCDATDVLPEPLELPRDIAPGDYIEFGRLGAYSLAGRTRFNGFYSDRVVRIEGPGPPST